jgi:hypothetical protein
MTLRATSHRAAGFAEGALTLLRRSAFAGWHVKAGGVDGWKVP